MEFKCSRKGRLKIDRIKEQNGKRERRQGDEEKAMASWNSQQGGEERMMMRVRETSLSPLVTIYLIDLYLTDTLMADRTIMKLFLWSVFYIRYIYYSLKIMF